MRRGRGLALLTAAVAMLVGAAGCASGPKVGDGVIGSDWAVLPVPTVPTPPTGVCTTAGIAQVDWVPSGLTSEPVDCVEQHVSETFHVGSLPADDATSVPEVGSEMFRAAYEDCVKHAIEFLGGSHRTARVFLLPLLPTARQWRGGARWYRCELLEITSANGDTAQRKGSLRNGLRGSRPLAISCANETLSKDRKYVEKIVFVGCRTRHDIELTGVYTAADGEYPGDELLNDKALDACFGIGAKYLGMTKAALDDTGGISWTAWGGGEDAWAVGDRSFWCFMGEYPSRKLTGSIKNRKPGSFPH